MNGYAIDSMTVLIKETKCKLLSKELKANVALVDIDTGEQYTNPRIKADVQIESVGFNTYYKYQNVLVGFNEYEPYITFTVHSKQLKEDYLKGITFETLPKAYAEIMSHGVVKFSFEDFLDSLVWDCDIRKDFSAEDFKVEKFTDAIGKLRQALKPEFKKISKEYKQKKNQGFQVSDRKNTKDPFYKLYNKKLELEFNSYGFNSMYLENQDISNEYRIEITFKRKQQMKDLGLLKEDDQNTLSNVLEGVDTRATKVFKDVQARYFMGLEDYEARQRDLAETDKIARKCLTTLKYALLKERDFPEAYAVQCVLDIHEPGKNLVAKYKRAAIAAYGLYMDSLAEAEDRLDLKLW